MDSTEILFLHYHQDLIDQQRFKSLFKALGVLWQKGDLDTKTDISDTDDVFIPLSMVINPKILDLVKSNRKSKDGPKTLSDGTAFDPALGTVKSMGDLTKEEFYRMIGQAMPSKLPPESKKELEKRWPKEKKQG